MELLIKNDEKNHHKIIIYCDGWSVGYIKTINNCSQHEWLDFDDPTLSVFLLSCVFSFIAVIISVFGN